LVLGLAVGGGGGMGVMWWAESRRAAYFEAQVEPLKAEVVRYRSGLQEEVVRTMRLADELRARPAGVEGR